MPTTSQIAIGDAYVNILANWSTLLKGLTPMKETLAKQLSDSISTAFGGLKLDPKIITGALTSVFVTIKSLIQASLREWEEYSDIVYRLRTSFQMLGENGEQSVDKIVDSVTRLSRTTRYSVAQLTEVAQLGTAYGLTGKKLESMVTAAAGLAARYNRDIRAMAYGLGRAYQGNIEYLRYFGLAQNIAFDATAADAYNAVIKEGANSLNIASGAAESYAGRLSQVKNEMSNMLREMGQFIDKSLGLTSVLESVKEAMIAIQKVMPAFREFMSYTPGIAGIPSHYSNLGRDISDKLKEGFKGFNFNGWWNQSMRDWMADLRGTEIGKEFEFQIKDMLDRLRSSDSILGAAKAVGDAIIDAMESAFNVEEHPILKWIFGKMRGVTGIEDRQQPVIKPNVVPGLPSEPRAKRTDSISQASAFWEKIQLDTNNISKEQLKVSQAQLDQLKRVEDALREGKYRFDPEREAAIAAAVERAKAEYEISGTKTSGRV